jgi:hypothetical protein
MSLGAARGTVVVSWPAALERFRGNALSNAMLCLHWVNYVARREICMDASIHHERLHLVITLST